ncbi:hypothetical protein C8F04DRAFT_1260492 [Mycena alexandri]|uniref:Uncharacterized protein n=1 Tax=Mycena alexandri TaxID=1745969 RepID=A0AAD6STW7_9AGAR|nr:hypothetical protein C8F04DRAFT_1260492 [Mycena alexandri]
MPNTPAATNAPSSDQELASLLSNVAALSKLALNMTRKCIDITEAVPRVLQAQVDAQVDTRIDAAIDDAVDAAFAAVNDSTGPAFYQSPAPTPDQMDARHPPGNNDNVPHYVITIGRRPGLYIGSQDAEDQVRGVPDMARKRKDNRQEALLWYCTQYALGKAMTISEIPPAQAAVGPRAGPSRLYTPAVQVSVTIG